MVEIRVLVLVFGFFLLIWMYVLRVVLNILLVSLCFFVWEWKYLMLFRSCGGRNLWIEVLIFVLLVMFLGYWDEGIWLSLSCFVCCRYWRVFLGFLVLYRWVKLRSIVELGVIVFFGFFYVVWMFLSRLIVFLVFVDLFFLVLFVWLVKIFFV